MNHPNPSQTYFKQFIYFYFSVGALEKKVAEKPRDKRFLKMKGVVDEERQKEIEETRMRREVAEKKIGTVEMQTEVKESELRELEKEVEELKNEIMEKIVRMKRGMLKKKQRREAVAKQKKDKMRQLDVRCLFSVLTLGVPPNYAQSGFLCQT